MSARRTTQQRGWVNFPTDRENSNEGGMYVQLVVVPKRRPTDPGIFDPCITRDEWMLCCGSLPQVMLSECLMHDSVHETPEVPEPPEGAPPEAFKAYVDELNKIPSAMAFHYPDYERRYPDFERGDVESERNFYAAHRSLDYLAVITLGSTGWSNGEWHCRVEDLTPEGLELYTWIQMLYGERGDVYLMTWLDT